MLVVIALRRYGAAAAGSRCVGYAAAALIATGVVIPLVDAASLTNFVGYVAWCAWLLRGPEPPGWTSTAEFRYSREGGPWDGTIKA